jgi:hypothetical protein
LDLLHELKLQVSKKKKKDSSMQKQRRNGINKTLQEELVGRRGKYTQEERLYAEAAAGVQQTTQTLDMERDP